MRRFYFILYLTLTSTGVSMDEAIIKVALGEEPDLQHKTRMYSYIKYFSLPVGKIVKEIKDYSDILKDDHVVFAHIAVKKGDIKEEITESKKRPGFVITKNKSKKVLMSISSNYEKYLVSKIYYE